MKSSTYFHMKTKTLAYFQIFISVTFKVHALKYVCNNVLMRRYFTNFTFIHCGGRYQPKRLAKVGESSLGAACHPSQILRYMRAS